MASVLVGCELQAGAPAPGGVALLHEGAPPPQVPQVPFRHADHEEVECLLCHAMADGHGQLTVRTLTDCRSCHHSPAQARECDACHAGVQTEARVRPHVETVRFAEGEATERALPFAHDRHASLECATCHTAPLSLSAAALSCGSCHEEHHRIDADCAACHQEAPEGTHPLEVVHRGCTGTGCHEELPIQGMLRTREGCLVCHQELADHRPERPCVDCHVLPLDEIHGPGGGP